MALLFVLHPREGRPFFDGTEAGSALFFASTQDSRTTKRPLAQESRVQSYVHYI